jgi:hypothetical protein
MESNTKIKEVLESYRERVGGPRDGNGGAVTEAMCAAAIGCRAYAKGEYFSK